MCRPSLFLSAIMNVVFEPLCIVRFTLISKPEQYSSISICVWMLPMKEYHSVPSKSGYCSKLNREECVTLGKQKQVNPLCTSCAQLESSQIRLRREGMTKKRLGVVDKWRRESAASLKFQIHLRPHCRVLIRFNYEKSSSAADLPTHLFPSFHPSVSFAFRHTFTSIVSLS